MSPAPPPSVGTGSPVGEDWRDPETLPAREVRELFTTLAKALRARQLYDENNPVYQRFVKNLRDAFRGLWTEVERLHVVVEEDRFTWMGEEVYREEHRTDSLAFLAYKDGVRDLSFLPGVEDGELDRFMDVLQRARYLRSQGEDLLTLLWDEDLELIRYSYVDFLAEVGAAPPDVEFDPDAIRQAIEGELREVGGGGLGIAEPDEEGTAGDEGEEGEEGDARGGGAPAQRPDGVVNQEDFNPTLYSLDPGELDTLQREVEREMQRDLRGDVLNALFDRLEEPGNPERQEEILSVLRVLLPTFLGHGVVASATFVLEELRAVLEKRSPNFSETARDRGERVFREISSPEALQELVRALQDGSLRCTPAELGAFLRHLHANALAPLLRAVEAASDPGLQEVLHESIRGIATSNRSAVAELLDSEDESVRVGALHLVGRLGLTDTAPAVARLLSAPEATVRHAAVQASGELRSATVMGAMQSVLTDPVPEIRMAAARVLGDVGYRPAAAAFRDLIQGKELRAADLSEKMAVFGAYGRLGDPQATDLLGKMLNNRGFLGRREPAEIRACAALGLGQMGSDAARKELEKATRDDDAVVRNAVSRALRGES